MTDKVLCVATLLRSTPKKKAATKTIITITKNKKKREREREREEGRERSSYVLEV